MSKFPDLYCTVFTWLNLVMFITLVPRASVVVIQNRLLLDARKNLSPCFRNQL